MAKNSGFYTAKQGLDFKSKERCFPTGLKLLDLAFGKFDPITKLPGLPQATVVEAFGPNASLKSALWENLAANIHKADKKYRVLALLAEEPQFTRFKDAGMDIDRTDCWTYYNPNDPSSISSSEEGLNLAIESISDPENNYALVVIDSLKALTTGDQAFSKKGEFKDLAEIDPIAARAKLINKFFSRFAVCNKSRAILFCTNQKTDRIGANYLTGWNFKTETSGGREKEHWAEVRIACNSTLPDVTDKVEKGLYENKIYDVISPVYYLEKNKLGYPFRKVKADFCLKEKRFKNEVNCLSAAEYLGIIQRNGNSNWNIKGVNQKGREVAENYLRDNPKVQDEIWKEIYPRHVELFGTAKAKSSKEEIEK
jgi:RecA/RadA recombinase